MPGSKWGYRQSSNGKTLRIITQELGPTIVFTYSEDQVEKIKARSKGPIKPTIKSKPSSLDKPSSEKDTLTRDTTEISKKVPEYWKLFQRYREKFPKTNPSHIAIFEWGREFSQYSASGTKTLYRGTRLRGEDYKPGKVLTLTHARDLISFSASKAQATQFALRRNGIGDRITGFSYLLQAEVPLSEIIVSPPILLAIGKRLKVLEKKNPYIYGEEAVDKDSSWGEIFIDEARDLLKHENEYFVLSNKLKVKILVKALDGKKIR